MPGLWLELEMMPDQSPTQSMKTLDILVGLLACGLLGGCAHDQPQPASSSVAQPGTPIVLGQTATFSVTGSTNGTPPLSYQWYFNGTNNIGGVTVNDTNTTGVRIIDSNTSGGTNQ